MILLKFRPTSVVFNTGCFNYIINSNISRNIKLSIKFLIMIVTLKTNSASSMLLKFRSMDTNCIPSSVNTANLAFFSRFRSCRAIIIAANFELRFIYLEYNLNIMYNKNMSHQHDQVLRVYYRNTRHINVSCFPVSQCLRHRSPPVYF